MADVNDNRNGIGLREKEREEHLSSDCPKDKEKDTKAQSFDEEKVEEVENNSD